jgi:outer membrane beta-barrel protein
MKDRLHIPMVLLLAILTLPATSHSTCPEPPETEGAGRSGLSRREFVKSLRHELNLYGGVYMSDVMGAAPLAGASYGFHMSEDFALEVSFGYTWLRSAVSRPIESYTGYSILQPRDARIYAGTLLWHPFHGKFMLFRSAIPHFDFYLLAGVGITDSRTAKGLTYSAGVGMKIFCTSWMSLRIEIRDNIHVEEMLASEALTNNLSLTLGAGFWIPFES